MIGVAGGVGLGAFASRAATPTTETLLRLDPGMKLDTVAPAFTLSDQFGRTVSLSALRGKVVVLSFNDPQCTTICPLTTTALLEAKQLLGKAGRNVELVGVGANPEATQVKWVRDYSEAHGMLHKWLFLTGPLAQMERVWSAYWIRAEVFNGTIDHTPATFVIDPKGRVTHLFLTPMSYSSVHQLAQVIAQGIADDLPGHPHVADNVSLKPIKPIRPRQRVTVGGAAGPKVSLGPGHGPQLVLFFNTWDPDIAANLKRLNRYAALNSVAPLSALDEGGLENPGDLDQLLSRVEPAYPVADDHDGRVADGYGVQDSPWLTLVSGKGKILWRYDVATKGWPSTEALVSRVHAALAPARS
jgi:cytochrome oxidase Cu insertion factor (SCO1/SenC/PrrC family)